MAVVGAADFARTRRFRDAMLVGVGVLEQQFPHLFGAERQPRPVAATPAPAARKPPRPAGSRRIPMRPVIAVSGIPTLLLPIGDLAAVMGRSVGRVRQLEKDGVLPPAPRRRRVAGHEGWRLYPSAYVLEVARIAAEERITSRRAVMDMSRFSERVWDTYRAMQATADAEAAPASA